MSRMCSPKAAGEQHRHQRHLQEDRSTYRPSWIVATDRSSISSREHPYLASIHRRLACFFRTTIQWPCKSSCASSKLRAGYTIATIDNMRKIHCITSYYAGRLEFKPPGVEFMMARSRNKNWLSRQATRVDPKETHPTFIPIPPQGLRRCCRTRVASRELMQLIATTGEFPADVVFLGVA